MPRCNLDLMVQFSCEQLREKRKRAMAVIADDQRLIRRFNAQIRNLEILSANKRAQIARLRGEIPHPGLPGPFGRDADGSSRRPGIGDIIVGNAEAIAQGIRNRQEIQRL